jgi:16S rRNA C1402 (ribose-2'-O) methylase RsmI
MYYVVICVALALAGVAGMQFLYLAYLEKVCQSQKKRIYELERRSDYLTRELYTAENKLARYTEFEIEESEEESEEENWAEFIGDEKLR